MKKINNILIKSFYCSNLVLIIFYIYPGSIFGQIMYDNPNHDPQITGDFLVSSNHFYVFALISTIGFLAYHNTKNINFIVKYLFSLSFFLEFSHTIIPNRGFEWKDLFGNIMGVVIILIVYKIIKKYEKNK